MSVSSPSSSRRVIVWTVLIFSALFSALSLSFSSQYGRLLFEVDYEDIISFLDGLIRYRAFAEGGLPAFVRGYFESPPHAPLHSLLATASFAVMGVRDIAPYVANSLILFAWFGAAIFACGVERLTLGRTVLALIFVAGFPLTFLTMHDFRPDYPAAIFTVWGVLLLIRWDPFRDRSGRCWLAGLAFAAALLFKPTVFPYTLAMGGIAWGLSLYLACQKRTGWRTLPEAAFRSWPFFAANALFALPHFLIAAPKLLAYMYRNQLGTDKASWSLKGSFFDNSFYHFLGYSGEFQLGSQKWLALGLVFLGLVLWVVFPMVRRALAEQSWLPLFIAALLAFFGVAVNHHDNPYFGLVFQMLLIVLALMVLLTIWDAMLRAKPVWIRWVGSGVIGIILVTPAVFGAAWPKYRHANHRGDLALMDYAQSVNREVYEIIRSRLGQADQKNVLLTTFGLISNHSIQWLGAKEGIDLNVFGPPNKPLEDLLWIVNQRDVPELIVDFAVATEPGAYGVHEFLPSAETAGDLLEALRDSPDYQQIAIVEGPDGKRAYIFQREPSFGGWTRAQGLSSRQPAVHQTKVPVRQFGLWPETRLTVNAGKAGPGELEFTLIPVKPDTRIRVVVNGSEVASLPSSLDRKPVRVSLTPTWVEGENDVVFHYEGANSSAGAAVTFTRLRVLGPGSTSVVVPR